MREMIVLVDDQGHEIGVADKLSSHNDHTPLHKAFSCYLFNDKGEFLLTQRALTKRVWPGVWTNSVCGHPGPTENTIAAIVRRLKYELGMTADEFKVLLPDYRYRTPPYNGIIENEICPVYIAKFKSETHINPDEVVATCWVNWDDFVRDAESDSTDTFSWWCKDQLKLLKSNPLIKRYSKPVKY